MNELSQACIAAAVEKTGKQREELKGVPHKLHLHLLHRSIS